MPGTFLHKNFSNDLKTYRGEDIGEKSLITRNELTFTIVTIIFGILLIGILGMLAYLIDRSYYRTSSHPHDEKIILIVTIITLAIVIGIGGWYYLYRVKRILDITDRISTDITRKTTMPMTDASLKSNLTDLISGRLGIKDEAGQRQILTSIRRTLNTDPNSYSDDPAYKTRLDDWNNFQENRPHTMENKL